MGDRGNLGFECEGRDPIWLYTHWEGGRLPELARIAIEAARPRWNDSPYATRMALTAIIGSVEGETGWGVDTAIGDNEHDYLVISWETQSVTVKTSDGLDLVVPFAQLDRLESFWE